MKFFSEKIIIVGSYLQGNIDKVAQGAGGWCLHLNIDKCFVMHFSRGKIDWDLNRGEGVYSLVVVGCPLLNHIGIWDW